MDYFRQGHPNRFRDSLKYFIEDGGVYYDITPIRETTGAGDVTFSASQGSHVITVTDTNHGCREGDFVTLAAASLGGAITADVLNQEFQVQTAPTTSTYTINARTASTSINQYYTGGARRQCRSSSRYSRGY